MAFGSANFGQKSPLFKDSPWAESHAQDTKQRVVGWRNGGGITKIEQEKILKDDKDAAQQYLDAKKAIASGRLKDIQEPLAGLPPTWQAFWSTVPGLDAQAAYRAYQKEETKREKTQQAVQQKKEEEEALAGMPKPAVPEVSTEGEEAILEEIAKLETEVRQKKQALVECQKRVEDWDVKLARARQHDREEEVAAKRMKRTLDAASFKHGIVQGKIRSSNIYHQFLHDDAAKTQAQKMITLQRSCAMMQGNIGQLKTEMKTLFKVYEEKMPSHVTEDASNASHTDDRGSQVASSPVAVRKSSPPGSPRATSPIGAKSPLAATSPIADGGDGFDD